MAVSQPLFSPKQVALALQASESSVKRWCDQGAIETIRTVGGHRKITLEALQDFLQRSNRTLVSPGSLGLRVSPQSVRPDIPGGDDEDQKQFRTALALGDEKTCRSLLRERMERFGGHRSRTADFLITDAMHGIGHAWNNHKIDAYQERRGCDICLRLINELRAELPSAAPSAPMAFGGTLPGDPYQIPTALVELSLRELGWNATSLGCNLPVESFLRASDHYSPALIWLSTSSFVTVEDFIRDENLLADQLPAETALVVGGRALTEQIRNRLTYSVFCDGLQQFTDFAWILSVSKSATN
ncbi:helix-turn-helix domain-containing protein [bacterium]|nr:helix-turn-helix domain-containing protein [bacterium]